MERRSLFVAFSIPKSVALNGIIHLFPLGNLFASNCKSFNASIENSLNTELRLFRALCLRFVRKIIGVSDLHDVKASVFAIHLCDGGIGHGRNLIDSFKRNARPSGEKHADNAAVRSDDDGFSLVLRRDFLNGRERAC